MKGLAVCLLGIAVFAGSPGAVLAKPRVPLLAPHTDDAVMGPFFNGLRERGLAPLTIHRATGLSPDIFKALVAYANALRSAGVTPRKERELLTLRTVQLHGGDAEFAIHRAAGLSCGLTEPQIETLDRWQSATVYNARERAILRYADALNATDGKVDDTVFVELNGHFTPQEIVELTLIASYYAGIVQFSHALALEQDTLTGVYGGC